MIKSNQEKLSISKQCQLLSIARSSCYYNAQGESIENLEVVLFVWTVMQQCKG